MQAVPLVPHLKLIVFVVGLRFVEVAPDGVHDEEEEGETEQDHYH
jgi:hypothetical protein